MAKKYDIDEKILNKMKERNSDEYLFILDGLDELSKNAMQGIYGNIKNLKFLRLVTSRPPSLQPKAERVYEILKLNDKSIKEISCKYLEIIGKGKDVDVFLKKLEESKVKDLAKNPLLLSILCLIYNQFGTLPESRIEIYDKIVEIAERHIRERMFIGI